MAVGMPARRERVAARPWMATLTAAALQFGIFIAAFFFVADSLVMSSATSRLLGRDGDTGDYGSGSASVVANQTSILAAGEQFDVQRAMGRLKEIAHTPHSLNDPRSISVRDYLRGTIEQIIDGTDAELGGTASNSTAVEFKMGGLLVYWEDSSLVVRVPGTGDRQEALLVQAHYDAVPMSHGAYDDGVGVVVCLELLQSLVQQPARHPVVINIDWGEENGLVGAQLFARFHQWAADIRAYINLEAGGVGGRAMVFRASHPALLLAYRQAAPAPHASLIGNSAFKLGIVKSDTDYSVYTTRYGIPGLDFAFTDHRSLYHTASDNADRVTAESIVSMGFSTLGTVRLIANSASILRSIPRSQRLPSRPTPSDARASHPYQAAHESFGDSSEIITVNDMRYIVVSAAISSTTTAVQDSIFYDVLSRAMVVRSYTADIVVNILTAVFGIAAIVCMQYPFVRPLPPSPLPSRNQDASVDWLLIRPSDRLVLQLGRGAFFGSLSEGAAVLAAAWAAGLLISFVGVGVLVAVVMPRLAYTHIVLFTLLIFASSALAITQVLALWAARSNMPDIRRMVWYSLCLLRCILLLVVVVPLEFAEIGLLYREQLYTWGAIVAAVLTALMDPDTALGSAWIRYVQSIAARVLERRNSAEARLEERLLQSDDQDSNNNDVIAGPEEALQPNLRFSRASHTAVSVVSHALSALRFISGVAVPLVIGMDIMLRQLIILKDHLVDGSPPMACIAIASLETAAFVTFMAPYIISAMVDMDSCWPMRFTSALVARAAERLSGPLDQPIFASGAVLSSSRSQISLRSNRGAASSYDTPESPNSSASSSAASATLHQPGSYDVDYQSDESESSRIIDLGPSGSRGRGEHGTSSGNTTSARHSRGASVDSDNGLGRRQTSIQLRKGEAPEVVGKRMVLAWAAFWMLLWVISQTVMLLGREYDSTTNPLKVGAFQTTRVSFACLQKNGSNEMCSSTTLKLSSPDSNGLVRMLNLAAPDDFGYSCFTQNVRDFYQCNIASQNIPVLPNASVPDSFDDAPWSPESAINITSISHKAQITDQGTLFTVSLNFSAPETRTCFIDFGAHRGLSQQAYPNPSPALPPVIYNAEISSESLFSTTNSSTPAIERTIIPIMERAWFVDGISGKAAPIAEPISDRDPVFSGRIYAHKRSFDSGGLFSANIQYTIPRPNAAKPSDVVADISCYFDMVDRHVPLLGSIISRAPKWATFKPAGNVLSTVTLYGVEV
ncbi:hypothetical protein IWW48_006258 [Coemansia sp. RSA 1200]|nr:hypothetical protein IWW48_006258 [Coemansia sp. RSA 1200]